MTIYRVTLSVLVLVLFNGCTLMTQPQPRSATVTPPFAYTAQSVDNNPYYLEDSHSSTPTSKGGKGTRAYSAPKDGKYHVVRQGDNVYQIARRYGRSVAEIAAWNGLNPPYALSVGQRLVISGGSSATPAPAAKSSMSVLSVRPTGGGCHTVARGETVYRIAKTYGQSVNEIMQWNGLRSYSLTVGSRLTVSPGTSCR